ncbi:phage antirepressor [Caloramator sp. Dgby_cultured_2]|uniref:phage antirepressor n=1 Tax=Caloramator sp. Dgby_cultured_2 TaxID=3029174 RepID=UPI00237E47ED|nr:phage antirepressor KilAC domain-containing protein [Caloramator sp. Dgby_cultured_2]WDU82303.1 BRO family protein [Caloramator sp. Dgby_cultured_2]
MSDLKIIDERELFGRKFRIFGTPEEPLFLAKDVAEWIDYDLSSVHKLVALVEEDEKVRKNVPTPGGEQEMWFLTEDGLYEVLMQSRKPIAKLFKKKVKEILKDIRKHGIYVTDKVLEKTLEDPDFMIELLTKYKEEKQRRLEAERINNILMHVNKTYTTTEIAKELGFKSAIALNEDLEKKKIQFKQNGTWVLYSKYANLGYVEIKQEVLDNGKVIYHRRWTQLGREFLLKLYNKEKEEQIS